MYYNSIDAPENSYSTYCSREFSSNQSLGYYARTVPRVTAVNYFPAVLAELFASKTMLC